MVLFENFRHSFAEFSSSIKVWEAVTEIEIYKSRKLGWVNLNSAQFDGNPILNFYNHEEKQGIRVIQLDKDSEPDLVSYTDSFGDAQSFHGKEIVISCVLSEENLEKYKEVLANFLVSPDFEIN